MLELTTREVQELAEYPQVIQLVIDFHERESTMGEAMDYDVSFHDRRIVELKAAKVAAQAQVCFEAGEHRED